MRTPDAAAATPAKKMSDFEADFDGAALAEAWRAHRREGLRHLVVTGRDGATLGTYAGDGAGDAAPPAQLVAAIVSQAQKMRLGNLESLVALYDRLASGGPRRAALRGDGRRGAGRGRGRYFGAQTRVRGGDAEDEPRIGTAAPMMDGPPCLPPRARARTSSVSRVARVADGRPRRRPTTPFFSPCPEAQQGRTFVYAGRCGEARVEEQGQVVGVGLRARDGRRVVALAFPGGKE